MCSTVCEVGIEADIASADTALTAALHEGVEHLSHDQSTALLARLRALTAKADALTLAVVGKVDADGTHTYDGCLSTGAWVRATAHQTPAEAARTVRTARALRSGALPNTSAALEAGALSGQHASVIADAVAGAPAGAVALIEPEAVAVAVEGDVRATANLMRAFTHALDPDTADEKALRRYERAGITISPLLDGGFAITGTADETTGAAIKAAIDAASPLVTGDTRTAARRRLDGLHAICRHWLDTAEPEPDRTSRRTSKSRAQLVVTLDHDGLTGRRSPGGTLTWAGPVAASTAQRLGCDSMATFVALDENGDGRRSRHPAAVLHDPPATGHGRPRRRHLLRTLLRPARRLVRRPPPHRRRPHGGPTTIANGALPCEGHHVQLHEGHWTLQRLPDGRYLLRHPRTGRTLGPEPPRPGHNRPPPPPTG